MSMFNWSYLQELRRKRQIRLGLLYHVDQYATKRSGVLAITYVVMAIAVFVATIITILVSILKSEVKPISVTPAPVVQVATAIPDPCGLPDVYCDGEPVPVSGQASWLVYERPDTCATRDWPKGTILLVSAKWSSITCVVRDFGPSKAIFPERIIDLNRDQFSALSDPRHGVIDVTVTPI